MRYIAREYHRPKMENHLRLKISVRAISIFRPKGHCLLTMDAIFLCCSKAVESSMHWCPLNQQKVSIESISETEDWPSIVLFARTQTTNLYGHESHSSDSNAYFLIGTNAIIRIGFIRIDRIFHLIVSNVNNGRFPLRGYSCAKAHRRSPNAGDQ